MNEGSISREVTDNYVWGYNVDNPSDLIGKVHKDDQTGTTIKFKSGWWEVTNHRDKFGNIGLKKRADQE